MPGIPLAGLFLLNQGVIQSRSARDDGMSRKRTYVGLHNIDNH